VEEYARRWLGVGVRELINAAVDVDRYRRDVAEHVVSAPGARPLIEVTSAELAALLKQVGTA